MISWLVEKTAAKFQTLAEAENADREFYQKLSGDQIIPLRRVPNRIDTLS